MTVGIALAAGGVIAAIGSNCCVAWLEQAFPGILDAGSDVVVSTASGGTMGYALFVSDRDRLWFPPYWKTASSGSLEEAGSTWAPRGKTWWAKGVWETGAITGDGVRGPRFYDPHHKEHEPKSWDLYVRETYDGYPDITELKPGFVPWYANFAYILQSKAPLKTGAKGYLKDPINAGLGMGYREMRSQATYPGDVSATERQAIDWSSSFWADPIAKNPLEWQVAKRILPHSPNGKYFFSDGGLVDPSAIVGLLRAQTDTIIAFYNNMGDFRVKDWPIKYLFGVDIANGRKSAATMGGPKYTQVFPSYLAAEVYKNLTDPNILRATLHNVPVLQNDWFGVRPYTLKSLHWTANGLSEDFLNSFRDPRIKSHLSSKFPNMYTDSMPILDANMLCMFQQWRGEKYKAEIADVLAEGTHASRLQG